MSRLDRRSFLSGAAALSLAACKAPGSWVTPVEGRKIRHAGIGVGGMGLADLKQIASHPDIEVVALCDVDTSRFEEALKVAPNAATYQDWRQLFRELADTLDSVHVSTPDHMHAPISMEAMRHGLHVYCQKPLTRTVAEARAMKRRASRSNVVTQMGIQNHSNKQYQTAHALFQRRPIGAVYEVHVWSDRPAGWWPQGVQRPEGEDPVPETLDWDLWLGTAPVRPYKKDTYHSFKWRGYEDFGTGAQGDMACHLMDPAIWFLELGAPLTVRSDGETPNGETYPLTSRVEYTFPPNRYTTRGPLKLTWHDGGNLPPVDLLERLGTDRDSIPKNACLFVGTKGAMIANPYGEQVLLPEADFADWRLQEREGTNHWHQWVDAIRGKATASAPFTYAAELTEVALLGNVALRFPHETLVWNADRMRFDGRPEANLYLSQPARDGWDVSGL